jgi:hypothetical protein
MRKSLVFFNLLAAVITLSGGELSRAERRRARAPEDDRQEHLNVGGVCSCTPSKIRLVHIDGGPVLHDRGVAVSLAEAQDFWRKWDGATSTPVVEHLPDPAADGTSVRREVYGGGKRGTEVIVYTMCGVDIPAGAKTKGVSAHTSAGTRM